MTIVGRIRRLRIQYEPGYEKRMWRKLLESDEDREMMLQVVAMEE